LAIRTPTGGKERRRGGDVEGAYCSAAGAARVHEQVGSFRRQADHRPAQGVGRAGNLVGCLPLHAEADEQRCDLRRRGFAAHHDAERFARLRLGERTAHCELADRLA